MPSKSIIEYARKQCVKSNQEFTLYAVLYKGGSVIRSCPNEVKTLGYRKKYFDRDFSRHAEMNAIHNIPRDVIEKCSLLVVRTDKQGGLRSAKPCSSCVSALWDSGIKKVYYSTYVGDVVKLDFAEFFTGDYRKEYLDDQSNAQ